MTTNLKPTDAIGVEFPHLAKQKRGFAVMDPARQREIASQGGKMAHYKGTAHEFTSEQAKVAGKLSHKNRKVKA